MLLFEYRVAVDKEENQSNWRPLWQATSVRLWFFRLPVKTKSDFLIGVKGSHPLDEVRWHLSLAHYFQEC